MESQAIWEAVTTAMRRQHKATSWACLYTDGKVLFERGDRPAALDAIEYEAARDPSHYTTLLSHSRAFDGDGARASLESRVAMIFRPAEENYVVSLLVRSGGLNSTFSFTTASGNGLRANSLSQSLHLAADWLETLQLTSIHKLPESAFSPPSRIRELSSAMCAIEDQLKVTYRPDRPILSDDGPTGGLTLQPFEPAS